MIRRSEKTRIISVKQSVLSLENGNYHFCADFVYLCVFQLFLEAVVLISGRNVTKADNGFKQKEFCQFSEVL